MIWVVCLLILWDDGTKQVYSGAKGQIMEWSEPELFVDFTDFFKSNKIATTANMKRVPSNACTLITRKNAEDFNYYEKQEND